MRDVRLINLRNVAERDQRLTAASALLFLNMVSEVYADPGALPDGAHRFPWTWWRDVRGASAVQFYEAVRELVFLGYLIPGELRGVPPQREYFFAYKSKELRRLKPTEIRRLEPTEFRGIKGSEIRRFKAAEIRRFKPTEKDGPPYKVSSGRNSLKKEGISGAEAPQARGKVASLPVKASGAVAPERDGEESTGAVAPNGKGLPNQLEQWRKVKEAVLKGAA